jgi:hypothetical protein
VLFRSDRARAGVEEQRRKEEALKARQAVDAARQRLAGGDDEGALALLDGIAAPSGALEGILREMREKIGEMRRQRQRQAAVFIDAAELAFSHHDYARAIALAGDAAKLDPSAAGLQEMRAQAESAQAAVEAAERKRKDVEEALAAASRAMDEGDLASAGAHLARARALDPDNPRMRSAGMRLQRAEAALVDQQHVAAEVATTGARGGRSRAFIIVAIVVIAIAVAVYYYFLR